MRMKRIVCLLLTVVLALGLLPEMSALAAGGYCPDGQHEWKKLSDTATCMKGGVAEYKCSVCGMTKRERTKALGHDYGDPQVYTPATCTEPGKNVRVCKRDNTHIWYIPTDPLGHDWGEWTVVKEPTQTENGLQQRVCKRDPAHVETQEIPKLVPEELSEEGRVMIVSVSGVPAQAKLGEWVNLTAVLKNTSETDFVFEDLECRDNRYGTVLVTSLVVTAKGSSIGPGEELAVPFRIRIAAENVDAAELAGTVRAYSHVWNAGLRYSDWVPYYVPLKTDAELAPGRIAVTGATAYGGEALVGTMIPVNVMVKNTGEEDWVFQGLRFYGAGGAKDSGKATKLLDGAGTTYKPGETYSHTIFLTVTEEDLETLQIDGFVDATAAAGDGLICSEKFPVHAGLRTDKDAMADITQVSHGSGDGLQADDWVSVSVSVKNTGYVPWTYSFIAFADKSTGTYNPTRQQSADEPAGSLFMPDEERTFTLQIRIIQDNVDEKTLSGTLAVTAQTGDGKSFQSPSQALNIALESEPRAKLSLVSATTGSGAGAKKGSGIPISLMFENTGSVPVEYWGADFDWADGSDAWKLSGCDSKRFQVIEPGEAFVEEGTLKVSDTDLIVGAINGKIHGIALNSNKDVKPLGFIYTEEKDVHIELDGKPGEPVLPALTLNVSASTVAPLVMTAAGVTEPVMYTVSVTNSGTVPVKPVRIELDDGYGIHSTPASTSALLYPGEIWGEPVTFGFDAEAKHADGKMHATFKGVCEYEGKEYGSDTRTIVHDVQDTEPWTVTKVTLLKQEEGGSKDPNGYTVGEEATFRVTVTNDSEVAIDSVTIHDELPGSSPDQTLHLLQPHESRDMTFTYKIRPEDIGDAVVNTALAGWVDPASGETCTQISNPVIIHTWEEPQRPGSLHVTKNVVGDPKNSSYYVKDEVIHFVVTVENDSDSVMTDVRLTDPLSASPGGIIGLYEKLDPHEKRSEDVFYTVKDFDQGVGSVVNTADAVGFDAGGEPRADSADASAHTGYPGENKSGMSLQKEEINRPAKGYYEPDDVIHYVITAANTGDTELYNIKLYDNLGWVPLGTIAVLQPGESRSFTFDYTVLAADMSWNWIYNSATGYYDAGRHTGVPVMSNEVRSPLKPGAPFPQKAEAVSCVTELTGLGAYSAAYTLTPCPTHGAVQARVRQMVGEAVTADERAEAWRQAAGLWQTAVREEYGAMLAGSGGAARVHLTAEQAFFEACAEASARMLDLLWPDDPARVNETLANLWMRQCTELCYLNGNAPAARPDSVVLAACEGLKDGPALTSSLAFADGGNGTVHILLRFGGTHADLHTGTLALLKDAVIRSDYADDFRKSQRMWVSAMNQYLSTHYNAGSDELRTALSAYRQAFNAAAAGHEALLTALYPDAPETVAEQMAMLWRNELLRICGGADDEDALTPVP